MFFAEYKNRDIAFWRTAPAALVGLSLLMGMISWSWALCWVIYLLFLGKWHEICLVALGALYVFCLIKEPPLPKIGYFTISSIEQQEDRTMYRGHLYVDGIRVPCTAKSKTHHPAICDYILKGRFQKIDARRLKFCKGAFRPVPRTFSLAETRFSTKERLREFLEKQLTRPRTASFLSALLTGDVTDKQLRYEFGRVGLQHILAISGFHFAILIAFLSFFLSRFVRPLFRDSLLLAGIAAYFLFVGNLPAVQRSAVTAALYLIGKLLKRDASGLNLLGVALIVEILVEPDVISHLGFQLSFLSCLGILLFQPLFPVNRFFPLPENRLGRLITHYLKAAVRLSLAVNAALLPVLLYHFHQFPPVSLIYNLFFPFLVSAAMFLLLSAMALHWVPWLGAKMFVICDFLTEQLLDIAAYPPSALDIPIQVDFIRPWMIPLWLFFLFYLTNRPSCDRISLFHGGRSSVG